MIYVVDSIMGSGKTTWAIDFINNNPDKQFCYVTPLLEQIYRIQKACPNMKIKDPKQVDGRKINGFNALLEQGRNIATTHSTFANSNDETLRLLKEGNYILLLDEVLDVLIGFNDIAANKIKSGDPKLMINEGLIAVDSSGKVKWLKPAYEDSSYSDVKRLADRGNLYYLDDSLFVWEFPAEIFGAFQETYIFTYLFDGSYLKPYFERNDMAYELLSLEDNQLIPYRPTPKDKLQAIQSLIELDNNPKRNNFKLFSLSKNFFSKRENKDEVKRLHDCIYNYIRNITKAKAQRIMWTAFDDDPHRKLEVKSVLQDRGYIRRQPTETELTAIANNECLSQAEKEKAIKRASRCYVSNNARASNEYRERDVVIYALNFYCNKYVQRYFENKNGIANKDVRVNEDMIALGCMLQFIWRSAIRDGKKINLYIPSVRMRTLFQHWLNGDFFCDAIV